MKISKPFWQVLGAGVLAGMRTSSGPVIASQILSHNKSKKIDRSALNFIRSNAVANTLKVIALGELIIDKLPSAPNRINPAGIAFRCVSGALAGAGIFKASGGNPALGAILGGTAAIASTYGSFYLRRVTVSRSGIIDPLIGAIEDALVIGAGVGLATI